MSPINNFAFIRLFFALTIIISHSYALTGVSEDNDLLYRITNGEIHFSSIRVTGFFAISGYLILESMKRSSSLTDYFIKRILRIFPGLFFALLITIAVGYFVTIAAPLDLLRDAGKYLVQNLTMIEVKYSLVGVMEHNPYPNTINGSLWTIQYEFLFYVLLAFLYPFRKNKKVLILILSFAFLSAFAVHFRYLYGKNFQVVYNTIVPYTSFNVWGLANFGLFFAGGAILSAIEIHSFKYPKSLLFGVLILTIGTIATGHFVEKSSYLLLPVLIILAGLSSTKGIKAFNKKTGGDLSYGIFLYGFLVQQTLMFFFPGLDAIKLMVLALPISIVCGFLSWHLVEKKTLRLTKRGPL